MTGSDSAAATQVMADTIGHELTLLLTTNFGGTRLYIPQVIADDHPICRALGRPAADKIASWGGGGSVDVPKRDLRQELHRTIVQARASGALTVAQIARAHDLSERQVYRILRRSRDLISIGG